MSVNRASFLFQPLHYSHSAAVKALSVITNLALSVLTCGAYAIYFLYKSSQVTSSNTPLSSIGVSRRNEIQLLEPVVVGKPSFSSPIQPSFMYPYGPKPDTQNRESPPEEKRGFQNDPHYELQPSTNYLSSGFVREASNKFHILHSSPISQQPIENYNPNNERRIFQPFPVHSFPIAYSVPLQPKSAVDGPIQREPSFLKALTQSSLLAPLPPPKKDRIRSDGNCLFQALSIKLSAFRGIKIDQNQVRRNIVQWLGDNYATDPLALKYILQAIEASKKARKNDLEQKNLTLKDIETWVSSSEEKNAIKAQMNANEIEKARLEIEMNFAGNSSLKVNTNGSPLTQDGIDWTNLYPLICQYISTMGESGTFGGLPEIYAMTKIDPSLKVVIHRSKPGNEWTTDFDLPHGNGPNQINLFHVDGNHFELDLL